MLRKKVFKMLINIKNMIKMIKNMNLKIIIKIIYLNIVIMKMKKNLKKKMKIIKILNLMNKKKKIMKYLILKNIEMKEKLNQKDLKKVKM